LTSIGFAQNGFQDSCDLWEEIRSNDFFWNLFTMQLAVSEGAKFAARMGDQSSASRYQNFYNQLLPKVKSHYNGQFVFETANRQKDGAVIEAFNDGYSGTLFSPLSTEVAGTIKTYNQLFCSTYPINIKDSQNGVPGILYGRYEGDRYGGGNPWVLTTAALAELFYRGARAAIEEQKLPEPAAYKIWTEILSIEESVATTLTLKDFAFKLSAAGDSVMQRLYYHVSGDGFHLAEQIDRNSGSQCSAADLTWSYANVLKALASRAQFYDAMK